MGKGLAAIPSSPVRLTSFLELTKLRHFCRGKIDEKELRMGVESSRVSVIHDLHFLELSGDKVWGQLT